MLFRSNNEYLYSLFVPSDASTVFPCFDQPDLKARFTLGVTAPERWKIVANSPLTRSTPAGNQLRREFAPTEPISTYLFAFAAGPFLEVTETSNSLDPAPVKLYVRQSRATRATLEGQELLGLNRRAIDWFSRYFAHPFPFAKYDLV